MDISVIIEKLDKALRVNITLGIDHLKLRITVPLNLTVFHLVFNKYYLCEGFA